MRYDLYKTAKTVIDVAYKYVISGTSGFMNKHFFRGPSK